MIASEVHAWQNDPAVQQILLFGSHRAKKRHDEGMAKQIAEGVEPYDLIDTGYGAVYKLRAVLNNDDSWTPIIRCGYTGFLLNEYNTRFDTPKECLDYLLHIVNETDFHKVK